MIEDWHTHNSRCNHAVGTLEDYIRKAIEFKINSIGFNDHFPYEFLKGFEGIPHEEYSMPLVEIESYLSTAENLREKYKDEINVKIGFEIDFIEDQEEALNEHLNKVINRLDYIHGSVHILKGNHGLFCFDDTRFLDKFNEYGTDNIYIEYFNTILKMLKSRLFDFDIVSHFDLPKKYNKFPSNKELMNDMALRTLELIKKKDKVMEINTGGFRKLVKEQYPSKEIIKEMYQLDIPILLGSDAHEPNEIAHEFTKIIKKLIEIGFNQLASFTGRKRTFFEI